MTNTKKVENIYKKLQDLRIAVQKEKIKKTGENKFANYTYYELQDFIPITNELMEKMGMTSNIRYGKEMAHLDIINTENTSEFIRFTTPMSSAELKGCHAVQNLGAVQTYLRRYLWITALELTEGDILDTNTGNSKTKEEPDVVGMTKKAIASAQNTEALDNLEEKVNNSKKLEKNKEELLKLISDKKEFLNGDE